MVTDNVSVILGFKSGLDILKSVRETEGGVRGEEKQVKSM